MEYRVTHTTRYRYTEPVTLCHNEARMTPVSDSRQTTRRSRFVVDPAPADQKERVDYFGNTVVYFALDMPHESLAITITSDVTTLPGPEPELSLQASWEQLLLQMRNDSSSTVLEASQFLAPSPLAPALSGEDTLQAQSLINDAFTPGRPVLDALETLNELIFTRYRYVPGATTIATPLSQVLKEKRGVCQDFAHVAIVALRQLGFPAAYVSGYLETIPPPGTTKLIGADASHAWFAVFLPGFGWLEYDPTNNQRPNERYVAVARGRDYSDVSPLKGVVFGGGSMSLSVGVDVTQQAGS